MRKLLFILTLSFAIFWAVGSAWGQGIDPQIVVCQSCTSAPGGDPNVISNTASFNVLLQGSKTLQSPLLVIVAVYDGNGVPSISFSGCSNPSACSAATVPTWGLSANTGTFTSTTGGDILSALGLTSGGSLNWTNLSNGDVYYGLAAPTSFSLYAFEVPTTLNSSGITIDESGAAAGSYLAAYGCISGGTSGCTKNGDIGQTVFTNVGFLDNTGQKPPIPEPASLVLLGTGLASVAGAVRRRRKAS